ncbi:MAG TPA: hypothetical protein ENH28_03925 [Euryarchaeota archaeon]|nr:hypothetical protein [Euryarchaeota archaeon]
MLFIMKTQQKTGEDAVERRVVEFLIDSGYEVRETLRVKGRYPDLVAVKGDRIVMVEVKGSMGDLRSGIARAIDYTSGSHLSYLAIPASRSTDKLRETAKSLGIGLMEVDDEVSVTIEPSGTAPLDSIRKRVLGKPRRGEKRRASSGRLILTKISRHRKVVKLLLEYPKRSFTIRELSRQAAAPYATVWRLINDLYSAGVVHLSRIGGSISCRLNTESPYLAEVEKILEIEASPHRLAANEFAEKSKNLPGIGRIIIFGSVARGEEKPESDVDIAVIVEDKRAEEEINRIADGILNRSRIKIIPLVLTHEEAAENTQFKEELKRGEVLYERD